MTKIARAEFLLVPALAMKTKLYWVRYWLMPFICVNSYFRLLARERGRASLPIRGEATNAGRLPGDAKSTVHGRRAIVSAVTAQLLLATRGLCHTGRFPLHLLATLCRQNLVRSRWALRDHKHRRRLRSVAFGVMQVTSEADVQDRRVGRRIRDSPEERSIPRVEPRDPHGKRTAAVQRQPSLALAPRQRNVRKCVLPLDHDLLPGVENLPRHWRKQLGRILV